MSAPPYMKLYIADYHVETTELDVIGHGAYLLLLMAMWRAGGRLSRDEGKLARLAKCTPEQWSSVRDDVMAHFRVSGGLIRHARVLKEIAKYEEAVNGASKAGKASAAKKANGNKEKCLTDVGVALNERRSDVEPELKQPEPEPEPKDEEEAIASLAAPSGATAPVTEPETPAKPKAPPIWLTDPQFAEAWRMCSDQMRKRSESREKTWPTWRAAAAKAGGADRLLAALGAYVRNDEDVKRTGGPGFHIWLKEGRWEHWLEAGDDGAGGIANLAAFDADRARLTAELERMEQAT